MATAGSKSGDERGGAEAVEAFAACQAGGGVELGDRDVEGDGEHRRRFDHDAHVSTVPLPFFAGTIDVPTAAHQHVGEQDQVAGKMHEHPLAAGFDRVHGAAGERRVVVDAREFGEDGLEAGDGLAGERAVEGAGGAEDGVAFGHVRRFPCRARCSGFRDVAHLQAEGRLHEAGLFEEAREEMVAGRGVVDFADQQSGAAGLAADGDCGERAGKFASEAGAVGFVLRQDDADGRIAAAQECGELSVDEDDAGAGGARHPVILAGPGQQAAVGIGGVRGGEMQGLGTFGFGAQAAQHVDGGGHARTALRRARRRTCRGGSSRSLPSS